MIAKGCSRTFSKRLDVRDVLEHVLDALPETVFTDVPERLATVPRRARAELALS
jgi:hypothetical protein